MSRVFALLILADVVSGWQLPELADYSEHPCKRDCLTTDGPKYCEYNFTVEHYQTLSRACFNCPTNASDCFRPHCVPGDGVRRAIKVVNRMMPGPALHVCKGDTVAVNVYNELLDFEGTAIHWHGLLQRGTPHMDGVTMITQCPIPTHSMFQYRFKAEDTGTHYWHAHAGLQRGDGIFGPIIVRDTNTTDNMRLYDYDLPEHVISVQDWQDQNTASKYILHHHGMDSSVPASILINGRGKSVRSAVQQGSDHGDHSASNHSDHSMGMDEHMMSTPELTTGTTINTMHTAGHLNHDDDMVYVPYHVFRVRQGMRYRFRIISNGIVNCPLKISVEKHNLTLIASDGYDMNPLEVDSVVIYAGERYDVVINANQTMGNYWLHVIGVGDCEMNALYQTAILRYEGAMEMNPHTTNSYSDGDRSGITANPLKFQGDIRTVADMTSDNPTQVIQSTSGIRKFFLSMEYNNVENDVFFHPEYYTLSDFAGIHSGDHAKHLYALQINHISYKAPSSPLLTQFGDISETVFCNETSKVRDCRQEFCRCVHRLVVSVNDIVELILISEGKNGLGYHPMHLHGHSFYVIGMEKVADSITRGEIETMDQRGQLNRTLQSPIKKDTVVVPDGGYTIIRFKADNPGFWLFHCHVNFHLSRGLSLVLQVGQPHQMAAVPRNFPTCGNWKFVDTNESTEQPFQCTSLGNKLSSIAHLSVLIVMTVVYVIV